MNLKSNIGRTRFLGVLEGLSFLLLLGVCMPLKYGFDMPGPTRFVGMIHGILFVAYLFFVLVLKTENKVSAKTSVLLMLASIIPFGTFYTDVKMLKPLEVEV